MPLSKSTKVSAYIKVLKVKVLILQNVQVHKFKMCTKSDLKAHCELVAEMAEMYKVEVVKVCFVIKMKVAKVGSD